MANKKEGELAGKHRDMGIKTIEGQDNEGQINRKQSGFNERTTHDLRKKEDESELNRLDDRDEIHDAGTV